jgi:hypothetical protein
VNAILVMIRLPETLTPEVRARVKEKASLGEVFGGGHAGTVIIALLSQLAGVAGFSVMTALFAIFCERRYGYDAAHVGYVLAYVGILGALMQGGLVRRLLKRRSKSRWRSRHGDSGREYGGAGAAAGEFGGQKSARSESRAAVTSHSVVVGHPRVALLLLLLVWRGDFDWEQSLDAVAQWAGVAYGWSRIARAG